MLSFRFGQNADHSETEINETLILTHFYFVFFFVPGWVWLPAITAVIFASSEMNHDILEDYRLLTRLVGYDFGSPCDSHSGFLRAPVFSPALRFRHCCQITKLLV